MSTPLITVEQTTTAGFAEGAITVDYPSGIAVDDLMILVLFCSSSDTISTPSGWTVVSNDTTVFQGDVNTDIYVYRKVVTSGDVTAGSISVDVADTSGELSYTCFRISGYNTASIVEQVDSGDDATSSSSSRSHTVSITPTTAGSLLIICAGADLTTAISAYSATGSPTFTEVSDYARSTSDRVSVAYAQINNTNEITNISYTAGTISRSQVLGFIVRTQADDSTALELITISASMQAPTVTGSAAVTLEGLTLSAGLHEPSASTPTPDWTNKDKGASGSVINKAKS